MKENCKKVVITGKIRKNKIGVYIGEENTAIGILHRIEFPGGEFGLYKAAAFKFISEKV